MKVLELDDEVAVVDCRYCWVQTCGVLLACNNCPEELACVSQMIG